MGRLAMGLVVFQADGRMMAVLCDGRASLPEGEPRQFMSYAGNYSFDGTTLSTRVDASSDASRVGGDQVRTVRFEDGLMVLAPPRRLYAGVMQHQELAWERIARLKPSGPVPCGNHLPRSAVVALTGTANMATSTNQSSSETPVVKTHRRSARGRDRTRRALRADDQHGGGGRHFRRAVAVLFPLTADGISQVGPCTA